MGFMISASNNGRDYIFYCEDGTCLISKKKPKKHKCKATSATASAEALEKCARRPHMKLFKGEYVMWRKPILIHQQPSLGYSRAPKTVVTERI